MVHEGATWCGLRLYKVHVVYIVPYEEEVAFSRRGWPQQKDPRGEGLCG